MKFRGVSIGPVTDIRFRLAEVTATTPEEFRIPVWFEVDLNSFPTSPTTVESGILQIGRASCRERV